MRRLRPPAAVALLGLLVLGWPALSFALAPLWVLGQDGPLTNPTDFRAFYCGGAALDAGADPYRVEPIGGCEQATAASAGLHMDPRHLLPAPLPPYALAFFGLFARLPFRAASQCWLALGVMSLAVAVAAVARLSRLRPLAVAAALVLSLGYASLVIGQIVPLIVAALALAALRARDGDVRGAAAGLAIVALEPHLALPACCGLALLPRARLPLAVLALALGALSVYGGVAKAVEYATSVVPAHARSELYNFGAQYSLSSLAATAGFSARDALTLGTVSYLALLAAGLILGDRLRRRFDDPAFALVTPVAAVLLGGPFVHIHQMAAALPLGLMLLGRAPAKSAQFGLLVFVVTALAIPWQTLAEVPAIAHAFPAKAVLLPAPDLPPARGGEPIERPYTAYMDAYGERKDPRSLLEQFVWKLPTWSALIVLLCVAAGYSRSRFPATLGFASALPRSGRRR
jgi:hypothetical protein